MPKPLPEAEPRTLACLRIWLTPGLGPRHAHRLLARVGDPESVVRAPWRDLTDLGLEPGVARDLVSARSGSRAEAEWKNARTLGSRILDIGHPDYPPLLLETADPPLVLYVRGRVWDLARPQLAIVGSRRPSPYGINCAERIARDLAEREVVVVSGLARGIDTAAHRGALTGGTTLAVLGTGVDRVYPSENASLSEAIRASGALVSEFPLGTLPLPQNFPRRNRILAGMTLGTLVVEAAQRSGSLITARLALEANREVFAIPGPILSTRSHGPHQLIRAGACLVTGWEDIARELAPGVELVPRHEPGDTVVAPLDPAEAAVLGRLSFDLDTPIDRILSESTAPASEVYAAVLSLELQGLIRKLPGDRYIRNTVTRTP